MRPSLRLLCAALSVSVACSDNNPPGPGPGPGKGLGDMCGGSTGGVCRKGLDCDSTSMTCVGSMSAADGDPCSIGPECASGYCAPNGRKGVCAQGGTGAKGSECKGDADCLGGLKCSFDGETLFPRCVESGPYDTGHECTGPAQCAQGLYCKSGVCEAVPLNPMFAPNGYPPFIPSATLQWQGVSCAQQKTGGVSALFMLPRDGDTELEKADFFRLPFPNDAARGANGLVDYSRFPRDPAPPFGFDALGRYLDVLGPEPFSNYPTITFRFDGPVKFSGFNAQGPNPQTRVIDLTTGRFGQAHGLFYLLSGGRSHYVCPNAFSVRPYTSDALLPGTYAIMLLKGVKGDDDVDAASSPDFDAMLGATAPLDAVQAAAWPAYEPLRRYLTMNSIAPSTVLVASVFTVGDGQRLVSQLAQAVAAQPTPVADPWVKCGSGAPSPCSDATGVRACGTSATFDEWHTVIDLPIFQQGTAPYMSPAAGGNIDPDAGVVRREKVCAALTTPTGAPPARGWPLAVYVHGTGGSFRSFAGDGAGAALASLGVDAGYDGGTLPSGYAMLSYDQVGHGPRRGARTDLSPDDIVYNFANPLSARGTTAQSAADLLGITRYAKSLGSAADAGLPALDTTRLVFWGQSQGATAGGLALAFDRTYEGALFTGASASLTDALLSKKRPVNIAGSLWIALGETGPEYVGVFHPVLTLLQGYIDPVDPINTARYLRVVPGAGTTPAFARNVLQLWGRGDTFTATPVQNIFAMQAGLTFVGPMVDTTDLTPVASVSGNSSGRTAAMRQYDPGALPDGGFVYDGHFVAFQDPQARRDGVLFLVRSVSGDVPRVPEP